MKKPDSLRAALVAANPALARDPQNLILWIDQGSIASPMTSAYGFAYRYRLNVLVLGFAGHQATIAIAILHWLRRHQPDLLQPGKNAIDFEADYLDNKSVDLQLTLTLTEQVVANQRDDGGFNMEFIEEPETLFPDDLSAALGMEPPPRLQSIWWQGERLIPDAPLA